MTGVPEVSAAEGAALVEGGALLLDVRNDNEWNAGHAPQATYITLRELPQRVAEVPKDRRIVAVCRVGSRSARATEFLVGQGLDAVNLAGGMRAWAAEGLPVVTVSGDAGEII
jgi:rhodanese-related sulfurtransferase